MSGETPIETLHCRICGCRNKTVLQEHHVVPKRHGGGDSENNIVVLCANCHEAVEKIYSDEFWSYVASLFGRKEKESVQSINAGICSPEDTLNRVDKIGKWELEVERRIRLKYRYNLVKTLFASGLSQTEIASMLQDSEHIESLSQQRVSQLVNSEDFQEVYKT